MSHHIGVGRTSVSGSRNDSRRVVELHALSQGSKAIRQEMSPRKLFAVFPLGGGSQGVLYSGK